MKIYCFTFRGESEWVFAPNMKEAKEFYMSLTVCFDLDEYTVKKVPKSEWVGLFIIDTNSIFDDEEIELNEDDYFNGYKKIETFAEYAERNTQTDMIAATEF